MLLVFFYRSVPKEELIAGLLEFYRRMEEGKTQVLIYEWNTKDLTKGSWGRKNKTYKALWAMRQDILKTLPKEANRQAIESTKTARTKN